PADALQRGGVRPVVRRRRPQGPGAGGEPVRLAGRGAVADGDGRGRREGALVDRGGALRRSAADPPERGGGRGSATRAGDGVRRRGPPSSAPTGQPAPRADALG